MKSSNVKITKKGGENTNMKMLRVELRSGKKTARDKFHDMIINKFIFISAQARHGLRDGQFAQNVRAKVTNLPNKLGRMSSHGSGAGTVNSARSRAWHLDGFVSVGRF